MQAIQIKPEEKETLDRLTGEIRAAATEAGADPQALQERVAADYRLVDSYLTAIYQEMAKIGLAPACRAGCDYCCYMTVYVAEAEAFHLAGFIERSERAAVLKAQVLAAAEAIRGTTDEDRFRNQIPCAFLDRQDGRCMVYEARPFICRTHNSTSRLGCRKAFREGSPTGVQGARVGAIRSTYVLGAVARQGYIQGLAQAGRASKGIELTAALAAIFSTENAYERWAGGEDVFAAARVPVRQAAEATA